MESRSIDSEEGIMPYRICELDKEHKVLKVISTTANFRKLTFKSLIFPRFILVDMEKAFIISDEATLLRYQLQCLGEEND